MIQKYREILNEYADLKYQYDELSHKNNIQIIKKIKKIKILC